MSSRSGEREAVNGVPLDEVLKHSAMAEKLSSQAVATNAESKQMSRGTEGKKPLSNFLFFILYYYLFIARHPELIDKRTGMVKMEECQRYFPAMTQGQVRCNFILFFFWQINHSVHIVIFIALFGSQRKD